MTMAIEKTTKDIIKAMLKENTGASFLDSGGAYGRNYERNQTRDFEKEPACLVEASEFNGEAEVSISFNLYHYLTAYLEYAPELQAKFEAFCERTDPSQDKGHTELMDDFARDKPNRFWGTTNTYNYDNLLSQVIQYTSFSPEGNDAEEGDEYILLQIHGGCDVRGGYTAPKVFKVLDSDYFSLAQHDVTASAGGHYWDSDDSGYHWYGSTFNDDKHELVFKVIDGKPFAEIQEPITEDPATMLFDKAQYGKPPTVTKLYPVEFTVSQDW